MRRVNVTVSRFWWLPLMMGGLLTDRRSRGRWLCVPVLVAMTATLSTAGKVTTRRQRPYLRDGSPPIGRLGIASSFPSTHAACAFAIAAWMRPSRPNSWLHLLAITIGYSRVRSRAHHFGDVVAGSTLGYAIGRSADWILTVVVGVAQGVRRGHHRIRHDQKLSSSHCSSESAVLPLANDRSSTRRKLIVALALVGIVASCLHSAVAYAQQQCAAPAVARAASAQHFSSLVIHLWVQRPAWLRPG
jgi:hypothetical protein